MTIWAKGLFSFISLSSVFMNQIKWMILMCIVYIKIKSNKCNIDSENTVFFKCGNTSVLLLQLAKKKMGPRRDLTDCNNSKSSQVVASKKLV